MATGSKKVVYAALIGNLFIACIKTLASVFTGSSAMMSEGIHSFVDSGNQGLLLYGLKRSKRPASEAFPFGHGREIYFWSFVVAIIIFALGGGVSLYEGIHRLSSPSELKDPWVNYLVLSVAILIEGAAWWIAIKELRKSKGEKGYLKAMSEGKDPALFVIVFEDSAAMLGLFVALFGVALTQLTGNPLWDAGASIVIGLILILTAAWLAIETKSLLIGEGVDPQVAKVIKKKVEEFSGVKEVKDILTMYLSADEILLAMNIDFHNHLTAGDIEKLVVQVETDLRSYNKALKKIFIEAQG